MNQWIFIAGFVVASGCLIAVVDSRKRKQSLAVLRAREALSDDEIFERFYADSGLSRSSVAEVWHEVADMLRVPFEHIRPHDKFGVDIGVRWGVGGDLDTLAEVAADRAKGLGLSIRQLRMNTVDHYVKCLARREPQSGRQDE